MNRPIMFGVLVCMLIMVSCARGPSSNPVNPELPSHELTNEIIASIPAGRSLLGYYRVAIDHATGEVTSVPERTSQWHLNTLMFLEPAAGGSLVSFTGVEVSGKYISLDVTIKHPFPGLSYYSGFDVRGIVLGSADTIDPTNPTRRWAGGPDSLKLLNADGWTRWWNPSEFENNGTVFSFRDGYYATNEAPSIVDATICGYKVFASALDPEDNLAPLLAVPLDHPIGRAVFTSSGIETRKYDLQFPDDGTGGPDLIFNYAVDASHGFPEDYQIGDPLEVPDDFPPDANSPEPFILDVQAPVHSVYLTEAGCFGGDIQLDIRISDWQALIRGTPIAEQIASIEVTSPTLFDGPRSPELIEDWTPSAPWALYSIYLEALTPDNWVDQQVLITIVSIDGDYQPDVSSYTGDQQLSSFYVVLVSVSGTSSTGQPGFGVNPLAPWPKPGGSIYNNNCTDTVGPANPSIAWEVQHISSDVQPVVDAEGRTYVARCTDCADINLDLYDSNGLQVGSIVVPGFEPFGNPMLVGCSILWSDINGNVVRIFQDGSWEMLYLPGSGYYYYGMMNVDNNGHGFVHGPYSFHAFLENGEFSWVHNGELGADSLFIGAPTILPNGLVVAGKIDVAGTGTPFQFLGIDQQSGEVEWEHTPVYDNAAPFGCAADPNTGTFIYTTFNHLVGVRNDGSQSWSWDGDNYFKPTVAISNGMVYVAESILGTSGGSSRLDALDIEGQFLWDYECNDSITAGPIADKNGSVYFATNDGTVRCLNPHGELTWEESLNSKPNFIMFGPDQSLLIGFTEDLDENSLVCLRD